MRMMRGFVALAAMFMALAGTARADAVQHVHCQIIADVSAVTPGKPFRLAVRLNIDPGWHVYWTNPGDAGLPTRVTFTVPDGFTVGPVEYPTPLRIEQPGPVVMFGYENTVLLTATVTPPAQLPADFSARFGVNVSWLVCADVCIPGKGDDAITLPASVNSSPVNAELFDGWARQAPIDASQSPDVASVNCSGTPGTSGSPRPVELQVVWKQSPPAGIQFLPELNDVYNIGPVQVDSSGNSTRITFSVETMAGKSAVGQKLSAVVGYENQAGERRGVTVPIFLPDNPG